MIENQGNAIGFYLVRRGRKRKSMIRRLQKECTLFSTDDGSENFLIAPDGKLYYVVD
jgi:hypothetical protein